METLSRRFGRVLEAMLHAAGLLLLFMAVMIGADVFLRNIGAGGIPPANELSEDSLYLITLLTAQLQAQNPLNPMDPNQMVTELTSMNTLQEIIQIRQDMDSLAKPPVATPPTTGATTGPLHSSAASVAFSPSTSNALAAGLAALTKSLGPSPAAAFASPSPFALSNTNKSQLF